MKKNILTLLLVSISYFSYSQSDVVQVIASGDGKSKDEALKISLRHCIEKTFKVFIYANTPIPNDSLVKDGISTLDSGSILSYEIISEISNSNYYTVTVAAQVSPNNIISIMNNKGYKLELNGSFFAQNILKEKFYKNEELSIIRDFILKWQKINLVDFDLINSTTPILQTETKIKEDNIYTKICQTCDEFTIHSYFPEEWNESNTEYENAYIPDFKKRFIETNILEVEKNGNGRRYIVLKNLTPENNFYIFDKNTPT